MKKVLSLLLVGIMVVSMVPTAFATTNYTNGTQVTYDATADNDGDGNPDSAEAWTVTVPALLAPGASGNVVAQGTWASNRKLTVTADDDVTLTNSINAADQKVLDVTFPGIELAGSNTAAVSDTKAVSVAGIDNALFGTWSGKFNYNVEMVDVTIAVSVATFREIDSSDGVGIVGEPVTLTWEELKDPANGAKYGYDASAISDTEIGNFAFMPNTFVYALESITIPEGITTIVDGAFYNCEELTSVTIPNSVTTIGDSVFSCCYALTNITFEGTIAQWNAITLGMDWNMSMCVEEIICSDGTISLS